MKYFAIVCSLILLSLSGFAAQKGKVTNNDATVFKDPDFDAEAIGTLKAGEIYDISDAQKGPFFKIRLKAGTVGWISDADIAPMGGRVVPPKPAPTPKADEPLADKKNKKKKPDAKKAAAAKKPAGKPLHKKRFRGLDISQVNFTENTMGKVRTSGMTFFGYRASGGHTLLDDETYIDMQVMASFSAPSYYSEVTGHGAGGFVLIADFMFITDLPQSRTTMAYYGFGPMFRFSQFSVEMDSNAGTKKAYKLSDAAIGAVFGGGVAVALGDRYALRLDARYLWEVQQYLTFGLAVQMDF